MSENPYAPPASDEPHVGDETHAPAPLASPGTRFANLLLDTLGYYLFAFVVAFVAALAGVQHVFRFGGGLLLMFSYYVFFEAVLGRTPGKFITGTRVLSVDGKHPSFKQVLARTLSRFVPFEPFSCLGEPSVGWHDSWSGTRVVKVR